MPALVSLRSVSRTYRSDAVVVSAVRDVSFDIRQGETLAIMGPSGSGKSTLMHMMGLLDTPSEGRIYLEGAAIADLSEDQRSRLRARKLGFVFQSYNLLPRTSALENVELPLLYNPKVSSRERETRAIGALDAVKLSERKNHLPNQMSGGQQQRVAIARALINEPVMILADEATGNLDTRTSYEIMALFQELNQRGKTIVFVTHEPDIAAFSARTITLRDGKIIKDSLNDSVRSAKKMLEQLPLSEET